MRTHLSGPSLCRRSPPSSLGAVGATAALHPVALHPQSLSPPSRPTHLPTHPPFPPALPPMQIVFLVLGCWGIGISTALKVFGKKEEAPAAPAK